jgi:hypothetical protein
VMVMLSLGTSGLGRGTWQVDVTPNYRGVAVPEEAPEAWQDSGCHPERSEGVELRG